MTRDQKPRLQTKTPKSASRGSTLVGIFVGLILGALVAAGIALYFTSSSPFPKARQDDRPAPAPQPPKPASEPIALPGKPGDKPVEKPRFDFYNVLPKGSDALPAPEKPEETTEIVNELLADGSNPDVDYDIEHHFACQDFDRLEKAAVDLFKAGFEVTDAEEMELDDGATIFCFDATIECKLNVEAIVADIAKMLPILEKYGVDYDGWGTYFQD